LESLKTAEKTRLDAVANAEPSVRAAVDALLAVMAAGRRVREVAEGVKVLLNDRSPMDSAASLRRISRSGLARWWPLCRHLRPKLSFSATSPWRAPSKFQNAGTGPRAKKSKSMA